MESDAFVMGATVSMMYVWAPTVLLFPAASTAKYISVVVLVIASGALYFDERIVGDFPSVV